MSASEDLPEIVAHSAESDPVEALRDALGDVLAGLIAAGCGPHHLREMIWETGRPEAFHLSRHTVELAYRETFAGFRPSIRLVPSAEPGLTIRARHAPAQPLPDTLVDGYGLRELGRQYSPRLQADMKALFRQWSRDGEAFRARHGAADLAYGADRFERLDLYRPAGATRAPIFVFIHGGYWQASDKVQHAQFSQGLLDAGYAVAMPNYGLAPDTPLEASIAQSVAALNFLVREADALGLDADSLHISGLYHLNPLGHLPLGRLLGLDDAARATRLSPIAQPRPTATRIAFAVGEGESDAFKAQSAALAATWQAPAPLICPGHHFSMLEGLNGGALLDLALQAAEGA